MLTLTILRGIIGIGLGAEIVVGFATFSEFVPAKTRGTWSASFRSATNERQTRQEAGCFLRKAGLYRRFSTAPIV